MFKIYWLGMYEDLFVETLDDIADAIKLCEEMEELGQAYQLYFYGSDGREYGIKIYG